MQVGDQVSDVEGRTPDGRVVRYRDAWQKKALVLITLPAKGDRGIAAYRDDLSRRAAEVTAHDALIIVRDGANPAVVITDRWGEVRYVGDRLLSVDEIVEWLRFVQMECPECQGETR